MNYEEIIKAWEKVLAIGDAPIGEYWGISLTTKLAKETFDFINSQQAEIEFLNEEISEERHENMCLNATIERLNDEIVSLKFPYKQQVEVSKELEAKIKSEARKELTMRFISLIGGYELSGTTPYKIIARAEKDIVELATEWDSEDLPIEVETDEE
jgi:hypothetical protein